VAWLSRYSQYLQNHQNQSLRFAARRTYSWDRLQITCRQVEVIESIVSWLNQGLITPDIGLSMSPSSEVEPHEIDDEVLDTIEWF
jgi:hypothetical protein